MIVTRFGTQVEKFISRDKDKSGSMWVTCKLKGMDGEREIHLGDLRADNGAKEIDPVVNALPLVKRKQKTT